MIKIDFEFHTQYGIFRDAIHLPDDHGLTETDIQVMKEQRRDNWIAVVTAPPVESTEETITEIQNTVEIAGETYRLLNGIPQSGAKLIEINGTWYYKV